MDKRILVINPGSTSTKLALFQGEQKLFDAAVRHSKEDLSPFSWVMEQADFRQTAIEKELSAHNVDLTTLDAVCARGGQLPYCAAGTYLVDQDMVDFMVHGPRCGPCLQSGLRAGPAYRPSAGYPRLHLRPRHRGRDDR